MRAIEQLAVFRAMTLWHQIWWTCTSVFIAGAIHFIYIWVQQCIMLKNFSGPLALPLVGNCYNAEALYLLRYLSSLRRRYGKIFTFFAFTKPYLVICDPVVVRRILSDTKTFNKGLDDTNQFAHPVVLDAHAAHASLPAVVLYVPAAHTIQCRLPSLVEYPPSPAAHTDFRMNT